jgi:hypothetical protein
VSSTTPAATAAAAAIDTRAQHGMVHRPSECRLGGDDNLFIVYSIRSFIQDHSIFLFDEHCCLALWPVRQQAHRRHRSS